MKLNAVQWIGLVLIVVGATLWVVDRWVVNLWGPAPMP